MKPKSSFSSSDFVIGQLLSLGPSGKELIALAKELCQLRRSDRSGKFLCDFLEKANVKMSHKGSPFLISKINRLELDDEALEVPLSPNSANSVCYYSNQTTGEIFSVDFLSKGELTIDLTYENYYETHKVTPTPMFDKFRSVVVRNQLGGKFQIFETENPNQILLLTGASEHMESNFWAIHNTCTWTVTRDASSYTLSGEGSLNVHYYENCNFHLCVGKFSFRPKSGLLSVEAVFSAIAKHILRTKLKLKLKYTIADGETGEKSTSDSRAHSRSSSANSSARYSTAVMGIQPTSVVKKLRRQLPIHRQKFDWNIARVQLINTL